MKGFAMDVKLPWGKEFLEVRLPDTWHVHLPKSIDISRGIATDETQIVRNALEKPVETEPLSRKALFRKKVLIIVDDNTRPTPADRFIHLIIEALEHAGADPSDIHVMPALGIHTAMSESEMSE